MKIFAIILSLTVSRNRVYDLIYLLYISALFFLCISNIDRASNENNNEIKDPTFL